MSDARETLLYCKTTRRTDQQYLSEAIGKFRGMASILRAEELVPEADQLSMMVDEVATVRIHG